MSLSQTHFQNTKNFQVHNSQFTNIGGNLTINNRDNSDPVLNILWPHVAAGAIFDSVERSAAGKCHPGTRTKIFEHITHWIADNDATQNVLWIHGPAGAGKSAIEHSMCELLKERHPESYGASFFFRSGHTDYGNARKLFTTLAYQLAIHFPSIRSQINDALSHDPSLPTKSMEIQFSFLIAQPLLNSRSLLSHSPILVIDGLDECADNEGTDTQRNIITLIGRLIVEHNLPLRVMIASRPEFWIRDAFDAAPLPTITEVLSLRDDEDADEDIKLYLVDGFEKIREENKRVMASVVPPWPSEKTICHFVEQASGQYIYPSTVLRFVGKSSRFINPQKQLEIITSPGSNHALGFSELDRLYITIVSAYPESELETMKRVLGGLLVCANTSIITAVLGVKPDDVTLVLDALSSLIDIVKPMPLPDEYLSDLEQIFGSLIDGRDEIFFCHMSFREFLIDEIRSGPFHVDLATIQHEIVGQFFDMILDCKIDQNHGIGPHCFVNLYHFGYYDSMANTTLNCLLDLSVEKLGILFSQVAEKLASFNPGSRSTDYLLRFMRGLEDIETITNNISCPATQLENAISLARQRAMHALSLSSVFKITPTLVYLAEYKAFAEDHNLFSINELCTIPGTIDVISTLRQHRHFLRWPSDDYTYVGNGQPEDNTIVLESMNMEAFCNPCPGKGSRLQGEWNTARIFLAHHYLKFSLSSDTYDRYSNSSDFLADYFFSSRETSDICTKQYFQNTTNLSILALMTDLALWTRFYQNHGAWDSDRLIVSILCWFNRQLTNQQTLRLLEDYDKSLLQKMTTTLTFIFDHSLLPHLVKFYENGLCVYMLGGIDETLEVLPLPHGFQMAQKGDFSAYDNWCHARWQSFFDEVFGKTGSKKSAIDPSHLYPLLASRLLFTLVRFLYGQIHLAFSTLDEQYEETFPYFTQCLPYAEPTPKNLDAIRAIVYLYPQSTRAAQDLMETQPWKKSPAWDPPEDFWCLIREFLQKYNCSVLSLEELDLFMLWLESPDHADITTYVERQRPRKRRKILLE